MSFRRKETMLDRSVAELHKISNGWYEDTDGVMRSITETEDFELLADKTMEAYKELASRFNKASGVYQRADRIITGDSELEVNVIDDPEMNTPARNNGREIQFNANLIEDLNTETITSLSGLNYHEVAHLLFSPRAGSNLGQYCVENRYVRAFNVLEEGRVETLLVNKYPATRLFLEATINDYLLKCSPDEWADTFLVTTGRKHLSLELRQIVADKFIAKYGIALAEELHNLIHTYRLLAFPADFDKAKELIARMAKIIGLDEIKQTNPNGEGGEGDSGNQQGNGLIKVNTPCPNNRPLLHKGRPVGKAEQERLQKAEGNKPNNSEQINADRANSDNNGMGEGGEGDYTGAERELNADDERVAKTLNNRMAEIHNNPSVKREVKDTRRAISGSDETRSSIPKATAQDMTPDTKAIAYARKFGRELERIARDNDPHWDKFLPSGKLNVARTMNPDVNAIGQMFDVWDTGSENNEIEAVILLDNSSSMGGSMRYVCETAWIIKRGIETIDGSVTAYTFSHESKVLYDRAERAKPNTYRHVHSTGSTNPIEGLLEAERIFHNSNKPNKMLFIVTDGEWANEQVCDKTITNMKREGVTVCVVFIGYYKGIMEQIALSKKGDESATKWLKGIRHGATIFHAVGNTRDVLPIASEIVKTTMKGKRVA
jgi:hypothetical protein